MGASLDGSVVGWERRWTVIFKSFHRFSMGFKSLAGTLKDFHILVLNPFQCCFGYMLGVIVLLEQKSSPQFKVFCILKQVLLMDLPVLHSIHCYLYSYKSPNPWCWMGDEPCSVPARHSTLNSGK